MSADRIELVDAADRIELSGGADALVLDGGGAVAPATVGQAVGGGTAGYALYVGAGGVLAQEATVSTSRLPATLAYKNASNTFTGATNTFDGHVAGRTAAFQSASSTPAVVAVPSASSNGLEWRDSDNATAGYTTAAGLLVASGAGLTSLPAGQLTGSVADARLSANVPLKNAANSFTATQTVQISDGSVPVVVNAVFAGADLQQWKIGGTTVARVNSSGYFTGNGSPLTNLTASNVATGTLADARLSSNVPLKNANNTLSGINTFGGVTLFSNSITGRTLVLAPVSDSVVLAIRQSSGGAQTQNLVEFQDGGGVAISWIDADAKFSGDGSSITTLNASAVASGTLADARLSANVPLKDAANTFTAAQTVSFPTTGGGLKPSRVASVPLSADLWSVDDAGNVNAYGDLTADRLFGDIGGCTGYPAEEVDGLEAFVVGILAALGLAFNLDFRLAANSAHLSTAV